MYHGIFINKIFDYSVQVGITRLKGVDDKMEYKFTGDIFHVNFYYNIINKLCHNIKSILLIIIKIIRFFQFYNF